LADTVLERIRVNPMVSWQKSEVAAAYTIGATLAQGTHASEGIAAIKEDLVSLDRTLSTAGVGLEYLTRLAEKVRAPGTHHAMPLPARSFALVPQAFPAPQSETALVSRVLDSTTPSESVRESYQPKVSAHSGLLPQPMSAAMPRQTNPLPEPPPLPKISAMLTAIAQEHLRTTSVLPRADMSFAKDSPVRHPDAAEHPPAAAPLGRVLAISTKLTDMPLDTIQRTDILPTAAAPTTSRAIDMPTIRLSPTSGMMTTAALSQASLIMGSSLPNLSPRVPPTMRRMDSFAPSVAPPMLETMDEVASRDASRPSSKCRQSMETAIEPSRGTIVLDGALLGRWVMDRLARQASRPVAGTTGIDPRINATFPGAPTSV
jgi:hypothetical protein